MKHLKTFSLLFLISLYPALALGMNDDSPFSSAEEKRFILEIAGRDGQIDRAEWEAGSTDRGDFKYLTWENLLNADLNGDSLVGVNEFYRYIERRLRSGEEETESAAEDSATDKRRKLQQRLEDAREESAGIDRRMLYERAQIARRTKFQKTDDPTKERLMDKRRRDHLKSITDRRRQATAQLGRISDEDLDRIRELYKSRVVKNRLVTESDSLSARRKTLSNEKRRRAAQSEEMSRRRKALSDIRRTRTPSRSSEYRRRLESATPRPVRPASIRSSQENDRNRGSSEIRNQIPARTNERGKKPKDKSRAPNGTMKRGSQSSGKPPSNRGR